MAEYDVIVVGSGFGGAVVACRLAAAGARVLVLERGREWTVSDYPRASGDAWIWDDRRPVEQHGWFDLRVFPHMSVVQGAGVGGGSLVCANVSVEPGADAFAEGWPPEIRHEVLVQHFAEVGRMLDVARVPESQWPERTRLLRDAAQRAGWGERFRPLELAVRFDPDWRYDQPNAHEVGRVEFTPNEHGELQGTCIHLGQCDIGCPVRARNTLEMNYLAVARRQGATIAPLHIVRTVRPNNRHIEVFAEGIQESGLRSRTFTGAVVVLSAGSLGSTEILLRSRERGFLQDLSPRLGFGWSSNGDFLTPALHPFRHVQPTRGPTITGAIDLLDGAYRGQPLFIEDGGFPDLVRDHLNRLAQDGTDPRARRIAATLLPLVTQVELFRHVMPWFAQARDAADGRLSLKDGALWLDWDIEASEATISAVASAHRKLASLTDGLPFTPLTWTIGRDLVTPHPLGGCNMGTSSADGVVSFEGRVFGHPNLYVADGAIVPRAIGLNPSRTIAALAEFIAARLVAQA